MSDSVVTLPTADTVNGTISRTLRALRGAHNIGTGQIVAALPIARGAYFSRLKGETDWTAAEVAELAALFRVPVSTFYDGLEGLGSPERTVTGEYEDNLLCFPIGATA